MNKRHRKKIAKKYPNGRPPALTLRSLRKAFLQMKTDAGVFETIGELRSIRGPTWAEPTEDITGFSPVPMLPPELFTVTSRPDEPYTVEVPVERGYDITYVRFNNPPPSSAGNPQAGGYVMAIDGDKLREEVVGTGKGVRLYWHRRGEKSLFKFPPIAE